MSLLDVVWTPEKITVVVDTLSGRVEGHADAKGGAPGEVCKMVTLPAFGAVMAARGSAALVHIVAFAANVHALSKPCDFDALLKHLPTWIGHAMRQLKSDAAAAGVAESAIAGFEVLLAGWSPARQQMVARVHFPEPGRREPACCDLDAELPVWLVPSWEHLPKPDPTTPAELLELARWQVPTVLAMGDTTGFGGRLIMAELTQGQTVVTDCGPV